MVVMARERAAVGRVRERAAVRDVRERARRMRMRERSTVGERSAVRALVVPVAVAVRVSAAAWGSGDGRDRRGHSGRDGRGERGAQKGEEDNGGAHFGRMQRGRTKKKRKRRKWRAGRPRTRSREPYIPVTAQVLTCREPNPARQPVAVKEVAVLFEPDLVDVAGMTWTAARF